MSQASLPPELRSLPVSVRVSLVEQLWDSIVDDQQAFEFTSAQQAELDRRLDAHEADPLRGKTWEVVRKRLLGE